MKKEIAAVLLGAVFLFGSGGAVAHAQEAPVLSPEVQAQIAALQSQIVILNQLIALLIQIRDLQSEAVVHQAATTQAIKDIKPTTTPMSETPLGAQEPAPKAPRFASFQMQGGRSVIVSADKPLDIKASTFSDGITLSNGYLSGGKSAANKFIGIGDAPRVPVYVYVLELSGLPETLVPFTGTFKDMDGIETTLPIKFQSGVGLE